MLAASEPPTTDLPELTHRQRAVWTSGDFHAVAATMSVVAERLCDAADLRAGWRVLDVACGSGNAALAAARCGCETTGADFVAHLLVRGRARAASEGLAVDFVEADAQSLPFPRASFDAVLSVFGTMFAADPVRASAEILRVCRPGGTIALASWTPDGFVGEMFALVGRHVPPPRGVSSPLHWGVEEKLRDLFGDGLLALGTQRRRFTFRYRSAEEFVAFFRRWYGPTVSAFAALDAPRQQRLASDLADLIRRHDRLGGRGAVAVPAEYLETVALRA